MIDWTKPIETIEGLSARVLCTDRDDPLFPVIVLVRRPKGSEYVTAVDMDGRSGPHQTIVNVKPKPIKVEAWAAVFPDGSFLLYEKEADARGYHHCHIVHLTGEYMP